MYIEAKNDLFEKRISKNKESYLYPKDEFLLSIWNKATSAVWINIFSNRLIDSNALSLQWSVNTIFNKDDDVFYLQPKSLKQMVEFDNLTDEEKLYLSLKYNPIEIYEEDSNVSSED